jgi:cytochrome c oxidase subunit 2
MNATRLALTVCTMVVLSACGSNADDVTLSPAAGEGRSIMRESGCGACHGSNGGGGVGPALTGLYGADVPLQDGTTVTADREYLTRSIVDPSADRVDGYDLPMPKVDLTADEIDAIITYIEAIGPDVEAAQP